MDKVEISWQNYITQLEQMAEEAAMRFKVQVVVGLVRGGCIPAIFISHWLGIPMIAFDPHLLHSNGTSRELIHLPISPLIIKKILIVDDIADTGKTFSKCTKFFNNRGFDYATMSVFTNKTTSIFVPDYEGIDSEKKRIVFPYEME